MNKLGENVFQVSSLLIQQALCVPSASSYTPFSEEALLSSFQYLSASNYAQLTFFLMHVGKYLPMELAHFRLDTFVEEVRPILQILAKFLGREDTNTVDKVILGMFSLMMNPKTIFDIPIF